MSSLYSVHVDAKEEIKMVAGRDGSLENLEITGVLSFRVTDEANSRLALQIDVGDGTSQIQVKNFSAFFVCAEIYIKTLYLTFPVSELCVFSLS